MYNKRYTKINEFENVTPSVTTDKLYMEGGVLKFNGSPAGSGSVPTGTITDSNLRWNGVAWVEATNLKVSSVATDATYQLNYLVGPLNATSNDLLFITGNVVFNYPELHSIVLTTNSDAGIIIGSDSVINDSTITTIASSTSLNSNIELNTTIAATSMIARHNFEADATYARMLMFATGSSLPFLEAHTTTNITNIRNGINSASIMLDDNRLSLSYIYSTAIAGILVNTGTYFSANITVLGAIITSQNSTYSTGVTNSCIIGGTTTTASKNSTVYTKAGQVTNVISNAAANYTMLESDYVIITTVASTITLIATPETGRKIIIKKIANPAVTINPAAGNIDGSASYNLNGSYASVTLQYSGTEWNII